MLTSIIVPVYGQHPYTQECLISIYECTDKNSYELILIDNGSNPKLEDELENLCMMDFKIIRNEENLGFPKACNQGIRESIGDYICLLNNDTVVTPGWLERMSWHLEHGLDIVGPRTNCIDGPQMCLIDRYDSKEELYNQAKIIYKKYKHKMWDFHRIVGFCILIKREVIEKVGLLDEIFSPGNFEDDDFDLRAIESGFTLGIVRDVFIHHFGSITHKSLNFNYEIGKLLDRNRKIFESKWSKEKIEELERLNGDRVKNGKK